MTDENGNIDCTNCVGCTNCTLCVGCTNCADSCNLHACVDCTDCHSCEDCVDCKHIAGHIGETGISDNMLPTLCYCPINRNQ